MECDNCQNEIRINGWDLTLDGQTLCDECLRKMAAQQANKEGER